MKLRDYEKKVRSLDWGVPEETILENELERYYNFKLVW